MTEEENIGSNYRSRKIHEKKKLFHRINEAK